MHSLKSRPTDCVSGYCCERRSRLTWDSGHIVQSLNIIIHHAVWPIWSDTPTPPHPVFLLRFRQFPWPGLYLKGVTGSTPSLPKTSKKFLGNVKNIADWHSMFALLWCQEKPSSMCNMQESAWAGSRWDRLSRLTHYRCPKSQQTDIYRPQNLRHVLLHSNMPHLHTTKW